MSSLHPSDPTWWRKKRMKNGHFSLALEPFLFTMDISHMQCFVIIVTVEDSWIGVEMSDLTPTSVLFVIG